MLLWQQQINRQYTMTSHVNIEIEEKGIGEKSNNQCFVQQQQKKREKEKKRVRTVDGKHQYTHTRDAIVSTEFLTNTIKVWA
mgnify:CR=1 FL=1